MTDHTPALQRPATRTARLSAIEQALLTRIVTSQSQLSQILADQGIEVTQATLSRDLDEIHATKTRLADGTVAYAVGKQNIDEHPVSNPDAKTEQQISRVLSGLSHPWPRHVISWSCTRHPAPRNMWPASSISSPSKACLAPSPEMTRSWLSAPRMMSPNGVRNGCLMSLPKRE